MAGTTLSDQELRAFMNATTAQIAALQHPTTSIDVDNNGNRRIVTGLLPNGDYGLAYYSRANDGTYQELFPSVSAFTASTLSTSSTSYTTLTGSPSVTVDIGMSGDCDVAVSSRIGTLAAGRSAGMELVVDGTPISASTWSPTLGSSAADLNASVTAMGRYSEIAGGTLTAGSHTFSLQYASLLGGTVEFVTVFLRIQPI
jgi:hypothetical protein